MANNIKAYTSLGKFLGEASEDVERYFRKIERFHAQANYTEQVKADMIPFGLEGKALDYYEGANAQIQGNYNAIKDAMIAHFKPTKSSNRLWEELCEVKKLNHQSVTEFYDSIRKKAEKIPGITDLNVLRIFMAGLKKPLKTNLRLMSPRQ